MAKKLTDGRRPRGYLQMEVNDLLKMIVSGEVQVEPGVNITPLFIRNLFKEVDGLDLEDCPSPGSLTSLLKKWSDIGYIWIEYNPVRFIDFTEQGRTLGLERLQEQAKNPVVHEEGCTREDPCKYCEERKIERQIAVTRARVREEARQREERLREEVARRQEIEENLPDPAREMIRQARIEAVRMPWEL